jgi:hypothetical protein
MYVLLPAHTELKRLEAASIFTVLAAEGAPGPIVLGFLVRERGGPRLTLLVSDRSPTGTGTMYDRTPSSLRG